VTSDIPPSPFNDASAASAAEAVDHGTDTPESIDELTAVTTQRDEYLDALQRMKAEFDNFRKRTERDRVAQRESASREVVADLLPVLDNLERAVGALADHEAVHGVDMVRQQLSHLLTQRGLTEIAADGERFDPAVHDAVLSQPTRDAEEGTVISVLERGYTLGDSVVRAARVVVAAAPVADPTEAE
jgi:molecular chaperone GrpE